MKIIAIGDMHCPWVSKACLDWIYNLIKQIQPHVIIQVGDSVDFYSTSKYPRNIFITPEQELLDARAVLEQFWDYIKKISPKSELHMLLGNHCIRPLKVSKECAPELLPFVEKQLKSFLTFDGVITHHNPREPAIIDNILFTHGHYSGAPGKHMQYYRRSCVVGHTHKGGVAFENTNEGIMFELNVGYVADPESKVMSYTATKFSKCTLGVGLIDNGVPIFIPFK